MIHSPSYPLPGHGSLAITGRELCLLQRGTEMCRFPTNNKLQEADMISHQSFIITPFKIEKEWCWFNSLLSVLFHVIWKSASSGIFFSCCNSSDLVENSVRKCRGSSLLFRIRGWKD